VCDQETSKNEEAKARYRAVENTTTMGCNARKATTKMGTIRHKRTISNRFCNVKSGGAYTEI
jgi:hypothetical protein